MIRYSEWLGRAHAARESVQQGLLHSHSLVAVTENAAEAGDLFGRHWLVIGQLIILVGIVVAQETGF